MPTLQTVGRSSYRHYASAISRVSKTSEKLARGEKLASFGAASDISIANRIRGEANVDTNLLSTIQNGEGIVALQDNVVSQFADIVSRMYELAAGSQDTSKSANDIAAMGLEYSSLATAIGTITLGSKWETFTPISSTAINCGISINAAGALITQNIAMPVSYGATQLLAAVQSPGFTDSLSGAITLISIMDNTTATHIGTVLSNMTAAVGSNMRVMEAAYSNQQVFINSKMSEQEAIRQIDPIKEVAIFTADSVQLNTAQVVQTQANNLISSLNRFLQSM